MKSTNIGDRVKAVVVIDVDRIERENGIVTVAGRVDVAGGKYWLSVPLECCQEVKNVN